MRLACSVALLLFTALGQEPKRVLFLTHSAGFRHDSIITARQTLESLAPSRFAVTSTEDLSFLTADRLKDFDAVFFFTSGELPIRDQQKADLLAFVRNGGGFAGAHSATDTLYGWAEYGELIGGYFDGHPWVGETDIEIEDPEHPANKGLGNTFRILDEIYKFRDFSRDRTRVLMTLRSSPSERHVNKAEYPLDSPLAWCRNFGRGRVFYTALGHFDETWRDPRIKQMLLEMLGWLTGASGDAASAEPRRAARPVIDRIVDAAQRDYAGAASPGAIVSVFGDNLTSGSTMSANEEPALRLAGTWAWLDARPLRIVFASPKRVDVLIPGDAPTEGLETLTLASTTEALRAQSAIRWRAATPGIYRATASTGQVTVIAGGLGGESAPRAEVDGIELPRTTMFAIKPGVFELQFARPNGISSGTRLLRLTANGQSTSFEVHWP
jgi:uncharacterized protein